MAKQIGDSEAFVFERTVGVNRRRLEVQRRGSELVTAQGFVGSRLRETRSAHESVRAARVALYREVFRLRTARIWEEVPQTLPATPKRAEILDRLHGRSDLWSTLLQASVEAPNHPALTEGTRLLNHRVEAEGVELTWDGVWIAAVTVRDTAAPLDTTIELVRHPAGAAIETLTVEAHDHPDRWAELVADGPLRGVHALDLHLRGVRLDALLPHLPELRILRAHSEFLQLDGVVRHPELRQLAMEFHASMFGSADAWYLPHLTSLHLRHRGLGTVDRALGARLAALPALHEVSLAHLEVEDGALVGWSGPGGSALRSVRLDRVTLGASDLDVLSALTEGGTMLSGTALVPRERLGLRVPGLRLSEAPAFVPYDEAHE